MDQADLITCESPVGPETTMARLVAAVKSRGLTVFARIDHAAGAAQAGMALRPTQLLIFGAPRTGTPLMQAVQTIGIDLPLRMLVWADAEGKTWVSYVDPEALARRHGLGNGLKTTIAGMAAGIAAIAEEATGPLSTDERLDEALEESFPASDAPDISPG
jgi:uncharacterized protein (DUF302 family)